MKNLTFTLTMLLAACSVISRAQAPTKPMVSNNQPAQKTTVRTPLTFNELLKNVQQISPNAAETLDAWNRFSHEPPAPPGLINVGHEVQQRLQITASLHHLFATQLIEGIRTQKDAAGEPLQAIMGSDSIAYIKQLSNSPGSEKFENGSRELREKVRKEIWPLVVPQGLLSQQMGVLKGPDPEVPQQASPHAASPQFDALLRQVGQEGKDAPVTLDVWRQIKSEPIPPGDPAYQERAALTEERQIGTLRVAGQLEYMFSTQMLAYASRAYLDKDQDPASQAKSDAAVGGINAITKSDMTKYIDGLHLFVPRNEAYNPERPTSPDSENELRNMIHKVAKPIVDASVGSSQPTAQPTK
jgi:hypothetical protein